MKTINKAIKLFTRIFDKKGINYRIVVSKKPVLILTLNERNLYNKSFTVYIKESNI